MYDTKSVKIKPIDTFSNQRGQSPLLVASKGGHTETAKLLIDKGADVNKRNQVCMTLNP